MAATRTQVYLTEEQRQRIDELAAIEGVTPAEIVRRAIDAYFSSHVPDASASFSRAFGALTDIDVPSRDEWQRV
ncbi:CopG family transcriptional regulator [Candidatus Poriferisodalis sp.]|uniref:ribbon-helix-helix domain-containing protein n=1 Tax=Candidatus Poriferisodalis sp. TaxID=3101277 RepID=UPI003B02804F